MSAASTRWLEASAGDPGQIAAETNRQLTAATNPVEHLQLGAVQVRDNGQAWRDPDKCVVLRREVMKVRDRRLRGPALGEELLPGGDLSLRLSIVERREESGRALPHDPRTTDAAGSQRPSGRRPDRTPPAPV